MKSILIHLKELGDVQKLVALNERQDFEIDATSGHYCVDAKSPMGFFSLDLSMPITLNILAEESEATRKYEEALRELFSA